MSRSTLLMQMVMAIRSWTACLIRRSVFSITWAETHKGLGYVEGWRILFAQRVHEWGKNKKDKIEKEWLTPSAASMKRTTPSEIRMLDVTSSEKFTWPLKETQSSITFCYDTSKHTFTNQNIQVTHNTWSIHDVEKVRFSSRVWQDHCDRSTFDTNSSLWEKHKIEIYSSRETIFLGTWPCKLPSYKDQAKLLKLTVFCHR